MSNDLRIDVRFGSKADMCAAKRHVCFTPNSDIKCDIMNVRFGPMRTIVYSFENLVGAQKKSGWN
jgi:hypothetical protein